MTPSMLVKHVYLLASPINPLNFNDKGQKGKPPDNATTIYMQTILTP